MKKSIETKIKLNAVFIYLLVALTCGGGFLYFYLSWKNIHTKKESVEIYNRELSNINELITVINEAQAEVNLFVVTERRRHLTNFQQLAKGISLSIDSLRMTQKDFGADTILVELTQLLKQKELSIIRLTRQYSSRSPIDSLSQSLSSLSEERSSASDSLAKAVTEVPAKKPKRNLWKRLFSSSREDTQPTVEIQPDTNKVLTPSDSIVIGQMIEKARIDYDQHISAIEYQINSVVMTDQYINSRITELLTMLYNQILNLRMEDMEDSEALLRKNNIRAIMVGGVALILILIFLLLILRNVQKGYAARLALEKANQRSRQLMESRHQLLLSVSHDVKTPLNSILGYIDLYRQENKLTNAETTPIFTSGNHIQALLYNLLEFSGLEKGSVTLAPRNFFPAEICKELYDMFLPLTNQKSLEFSYRISLPSQLILFSDSLKIKQILTNILSNAVKYTTEGEVVFEADYKDNILTFTISDTGVGIPADKQENLFMPFTRIKESSVLDEGSGFGLFVVKGLVELFEGEINFRSETGKGTQITIKLPVSEGEGKTEDRQLKKILIIDDDEVFLDMLSRLCKQLGHEVKSCKNAQELDDEISNIYSYHCVLTDMEMGSFSGRDVLKRIRDKNKDIPVFVITGRSDLSPATIASEGFTGYLLKPINLNGLYSLIGGKINNNPSDDLVSLLDNDKEAITEIMEKFFISTVNSIVMLKDAVATQNFTQAQYLCHKMLPMFLQADAPDEITRIMKYIDRLRGDNKPDDTIWEQLLLLTEKIEKYLSSIHEKYLND